MARFENGAQQSSADNIVTIPLPAFSGPVEVEKKLMKEAEMERKERERMFFNLSGESLLTGSV